MTILIKLCMPTCTVFSWIRRAHFSSSNAVLKAELESLRSYLSEPVLVYRMIFLSSLRQTHPFWPGCWLITVILVHIRMLKFESDMCCRNHLCILSLPALSSSHWTFHQHSKVNHASYERISLTRVDDTYNKRINNYEIMACTYNDQSLNCEGAAA